MAERPHLVEDRLPSCCKAEQSVHSSTCNGSKPTYATRWGPPSCCVRRCSALTMKNINHNIDIDLETPQITCANIITMKNTTCSGACCVIINISADEQQLLKHS